MIKHSRRSPPAIVRRTLPPSCPAHSGIQLQNIALCRLTSPHLPSPPLTVPHCTEQSASFSSYAVNHPPKTRPRPDPRGPRQYSEYSVIGLAPPSSPEQDSVLASLILCHFCHTEESYLLYVQLQPPTINRVYCTQHLEIPQRLQTT